MLGCVRPVSFGCFGVTLLFSLGGANQILGGPNQSCHVALVMTTGWPSLYFKQIVCRIIGGVRSSCSSVCACVLCGLSCCEVLAWAAPMQHRQGSWLPELIEQASGKCAPDEHTAYNIQLNHITPVQQLQLTSCTWHT